MVGDTAALRSMATGLRQRAADTRADADAVLRQAATTGWEGRAADAARARARDRTDGLDRTAAAYDDAAAALDRHAEEVDAARAALGGLDLPGPWW